MATTGSYDKLSIINSALIVSGENPVAVGDDGSTEWTVCSVAYDDGLRLVLAGGNWDFATALADLARFGDSTYPGYTDRFDFPDDAYQVLNVWRTDEAAQVWPETGWGQPSEPPLAPGLNYKVIGRGIYCSAPNGVTCMYVRDSLSQTPWPEEFAETLRLWVRSAICTGLQDDDGRAQYWRKEAKAQMREAEARNSGQEPRKALLRSRLAEDRRMRRGGRW